MGKLLDQFIMLLATVQGLIPPSLLHVVESHIQHVQQSIEKHSQTLDYAIPMFAAFRFYVQVACSGITGARRTFNAAFADFEAWELALISSLATLLCAWMYSVLATLYDDGGMKVIYTAIRSLPFIRGYINKEKAKLRQGLLSERNAHAGESKQLQQQFKELPAEGFSSEEVLAMLQSKAKGDLQVEEGQSHLSGAVYIGSHSHQKLLDSAHELFSLTNPLHASVWPSVRQMEAEVVAMTAAMLGGGAHGPAPSVCGAMTSGGTESILSAMKASRDYMRQVKGIRRPEMILAVSAHAAYWKACEYFKIKAVVVNVGKDYRLSGRTVSRCLTANTAIIVASAPGFPHGVVDHVEDIAKVAKRAGVCLHVDACLGGFVLPFARQLGYAVPPFDFSVAGVTSMSVDTHKFGMAHKGTSVVLYRSSEIRQHQYTGITDWSGGLYISPGLAGSRPGALIASAWASLVKCGTAGYLEACRGMMAAVARFTEGLRREVPELRLVGEPDMSVVAFMAVRPSLLNIYKVNDVMTSKGWHLNALQSPPACHFCFTAAHSVELVDKLLLDLRVSVQQVLADPNNVSGGSAPMYGMANVVPDRGMIAEFLVAYQDVMLEP